MPRDRALAAEWRLGPEEAETLRESVRRAAVSRVRDWNEGVVVDLVGRCYDASLDPMMWSGFLEKLSDAVHGSQSDIVVQDLDPRNGGFSFFARYDPDYIRSYRDYYVTVNPGLWCERIFQTGVVGTIEALRPIEAWRRTEFYNDWMGPQGIVTEVGGTVFREESLLCGIDVWGTNREPFTAKECALLLILMPHLQRAIQIHRRLTGLELERDHVAEGLEKLSWGVILIDAKGAVVLVNQRAREILGQNDGLTVRRRMLHAQIPRETDRLRGLLTGATSTGHGEGVHSGGAMSVSRPSLSRPYSLLVAPLRAGTDPFAANGAAAMVFLTDPEANTETPPELLQHLYGLTPAESRFCALFLEGYSVETIAERLAISIHTARVYLKRILAKTDTRRQSELIRLLLRGPASLELRDAPGS